MLIKSTYKNSIVISSDALTATRAAIFAGDTTTYNTLTITAERNCCESESIMDVSSLRALTYTESNSVVYSTRIRKFTLPKSKLSITGITLIDSFTGKPLKIVFDSEIVINSNSDFSDLKDAIDTYLQQHLPNIWVSNGPLITEQPAIFITTWELITTYEGVVTYSPYAYILQSIDYNANDVKNLSIETTVENSEHDVTFFKKFNNHDQNNGDVLLTNHFFNLPDIKNGIYTITVLISSISGSYTVESSCFFYDYGIKELILSSNLNEEDKEKAWLIYYTLEQSNNCACDCIIMCDLYKQLIIILGKYNSILLNEDCNCS